MRLRQWVFVLVAAMLALPMVTVAAPQGEMLAVVQDMMTAFNAGDVDATMAFWTEDAVMEVPHMGATYHGAAEIQSIFETLISQSFQMNIIEQLEERVDGVVTRSHFTSDPLKAMGVDVESVQTYTFRDGKISKLYCAWTPESLSAIAAAQAKAAKEPAAVVKALVEVVQARDLEGYMGSWADGAVLEVIGSDEKYEGADELRAFFESRMAINYQPDVTIKEVSGDFAHR